VQRTYAVCLSELRAVLQINTHHPLLLEQAASVTSLSDSLSQVRTGLAEVEGSVDRQADISFLCPKEPRLV
jgi:hypothetical protein